MVREKGSLRFRRAHNVGGYTLALRTLLRDPHLSSQTCLDLKLLLARHLGAVGGTLPS